MDICRNGLLLGVKAGAEPFIGVVALSGIRPVNQTGSDGRHADHLIIYIGLFVIQAFAHIVQGMQGIQRNPAHQILVLCPRVAEHRQKVIECLSNALVLCTGGLEVCDNKGLEQLRRYVNVTNDTAEQEFGDGHSSGRLDLGRSSASAQGLDVNLEEIGVIREQLRAVHIENIGKNMQGGDLESSVALCEEMHKQGEVLLGKRAVEERAKAETDETTLANRGLVAAHGGNDEVVEHGN